MNHALRHLVQAPCVVLHRMWWIPGWNRSAWLTCPIAQLCHHSPRFNNWFWELP